jgi:UDP-2,3-diacylglucosamine pyrophosphatase LpxH
MRTGISFSDVHFGVDDTVITTNQKLLMDTLDDLHEEIDKGFRYKFDELVLNGDIIEAWYSRVYKNMKDYKVFLDIFFEKFERISNSWHIIVGNHDTLKLKPIFPKQVEEYLLARGWTISSEYVSKELYIAHGHLGEYTKLTVFLASFFIRLAYVVSAFLAPVVGGVIDFFKNPIASWLNHKGKSSEKNKALEQYAKILKRHPNSEGCLIKMFGHTHMPIILEEISVINSGDWMENATFITYEVNSSAITAKLNRNVNGEIKEIGLITRPLTH